MTPDAPSTHRTHSASAKHCPQHVAPEDVLNRCTRHACSAGGSSLKRRKTAMPLDLFNTSRYTDDLPDSLEVDATAAAAGARTFSSACQQLLREPVY
jgi:hypothetical protein